MMGQRGALMLAISVLCMTSVVSAFEWEYCGDKASSLQTLSEVKIFPEDPIPAGTEAHFSIKGVSKIEVDDSKLSIKVYYLGLPVYHKTTDVHEHIPVGPFTSDVHEQLPSYTPPGNYKVVIESDTTDGRQLSCVNVHFKITWPAFKRSQTWLA